MQTPLPPASQAMDEGASPLICGAMKSPAINRKAIPYQESGSIPHLGEHRFEMRTKDACDDSE